MSKTLILRKTLLAATIATLTACSGGSDSTTATAANTSSSTGVITGFGSVYINGVEYETGTASVDVDGLASDERNLGVGDVCVIEGTVNADGTTGTAVSVVCADELEGYVTDVSGLDATTGVGTIIVMGQTISITLDTVFEGDGATKLSVADLLANDVVEVSGFSDGSGTVFATRIETKELDDEVQVKGTVSQLDDVAKTFVIGELTIDYGNTTNMPILVDGLLVEVDTVDPLASVVTTDPDTLVETTTLTMVANEIEIEEGGEKKIDGEEGDEIKMQGLITGLDTVAGTFMFNGSVIDIATLDDEFDTSLLVDGTMMTVEGYIDADGNFVVEEIQDEKETENEMEGVFVSKTESTVTITVDGGLTTSTFMVNNSTRMIDEMGTAPLKYFSLRDIGSSDSLEIEYYTEGGVNTATGLERGDVEMEEAPAEGPAATTQP